MNIIHLTHEEFILAWNYYPSDPLVFGIDSLGLRGRMFAADSKVFIDTSAIWLGKGDYTTTLQHELLHVAGHPEHTLIGVQSFSPLFRGSLGWNIILLSMVIIILIMLYLSFKKK